MRQIPGGISVTFAFVSIVFRNDSIFVKCDYIFGKLNHHTSGLCIFCENDARFNEKTLSIQNC